MIENKKWIIYILKKYIYLNININNLPIKVYSSGITIWELFLYLKNIL